jgi:hypothetical protein
MLYLENIYGKEGHCVTERTDHLIAGGRRMLIGFEQL